MDKYNIYYDKLIVNARDKKKVCLEHDIDLLIDDSISNCLSVSSAGIPTVMIGNNKTLNNKIENFNDWKQIYDFLKYKYHF